MKGGLAEALEAARAAHPLLIPYVTGGLPGVTPSFIRALAGTGADAIEVGIPFSDPVMDGPVIQEASRRALAAEATPAGVLRAVEEGAPAVPVAVMTYLNPVLAMGQDRFLDLAAASSVSGLIIPDLPVDEAEELAAGCRTRGVCPVFLATPNATDDRLARVALASEGFVYCVATLGVTGARDRLAASASTLVRRLRSLTPKPLVLGVGISTPEQAREAAAFADGVVVGTAIVEPLLAGAPERSLAVVAAFRRALDESR
jgi:tryptophan synthase alpha chain